MNTLFLYENLSSGGIISVIKERIREIKAGKIYLYFQNDHGGEASFSGLENINIIIGKFGHADNIKEIFFQNNISSIIFFSNYNLVPYFIEKAEKVTVEYHRSDEKSLSELIKFIPPEVRVIVPSHWSKCLVEKIWQGSAEIVPNKINKDAFFSSGQRNLSLLPEYVFVGQHSYPKGLDHCIRGFKIFCDVVGPRRLNVVISQKGTDQQVIALTRELDLLNLSKTTDVLWSLNQSDLAEIYRRCALTGGANLICSQRESFGLSVLEARECGLPTIASHVAAIPELLSTNDLTYQMGNLEDFKRVLMEHEVRLKSGS